MPVLVAFSFALASGSAVARDYSEQADKVVAAVKHVESKFVETAIAAKFWDNILAAFATSALDRAAFDKCIGPVDKLNSLPQIEQAIKCGKGEDAADQYVDRVLQAAMQSLGERNSFVTANEMARFRVETGDYVMVGVSLTEKEGRIEIVDLHGRSPLREFGVKRGDVITAIAGRSGAELTLDAAVELLRGKPGEIVTISVARQGETTPSELSVTRKILEPEHFQIERRGNHAVVRALTMDYDGSEELELELSKPEYRKLDGIILDLRHNQGGLLDEVVALADLFVEKGELFYVCGRNPADTERFYARKNKRRYQKPVVVLVDKVTASGGEIIAAVLQYHKRAHVRAKRRWVLSIFRPFCQSAGTARSG